MNRLREKYNKEVVPKLVEKYKYTSVMEVPKLEKIVINIGVGDAKENRKFLEASVNELELITRKMCQNKFKKISLNLLYKEIYSRFQNKRRSRNWM